VYSLPVIHSVALVAWLTFTIVALQLSLKHILPDDQSKTVSILLGTVFLFVILLLDPNIPQTLYWWNGMRSYVLPLILLTLYMVLLRIGAEKLGDQRRKAVGFLISFLFALIIGGLGETYIVFQIVFLLYLLVLELIVHRDRKSTSFQLLFAGWIGSLVAFVILVSAPGNAIRQANFPPHASIAVLLQISIQSYLDFIFDILRSPEKITGLLGAMLIFIYFGTHSEHESDVKRWFVPTLLIGAFMLSFACFVPGAYATSEPTAERTIIIPIFGLAFFLLWAGFLLGQQLSASSKGSRLLGSVVPIIAVFMLTCSAILSFQNTYSIRTIYIDFAQRWDGADTQILSARVRGAESVTIPDMNVPTGPEGIRLTTRDIGSTNAIHCTMVCKCLVPVRTCSDHTR
jgi:hypothetical protein